MNGAHVGAWSLAPNAPDTLQYDLAWTQSEQGRPLSLSLPFTPGNAPHRGAKVRAYFENLLPDSKDIRERLARRFSTGSTDAFHLLAEIGRDCVGALEILPDGQVSTGISPLQAEPLSEARVAQVLRGATTSNPMGWGTEDDLRISIAGAQEKTALLQRDRQWCLPQGDTPTTHIFKLPLGLIGGMKLDMRDSVENEWLCSLILKEFGLPVANCQPMQFEDLKVLVVERFDRAWWTHPSGDNRLIRLPQEDMCQALGVHPEAKYEADGGPGMDRILDVLDGSMTREKDRRDFFKAQLLFWMLCATDGHAKNFSLFLRPGGRYQLTPLYDVLSAYPVLGEGPSMVSPFRAKLAMAVRSKNAHWRMRDILRRHWLALGARHGVVTEDGREVAFLIDEVVSRTPQVIAAVRARLPDGFPMRVANSILDGLQGAGRRLADPERL
ncbi:serine/threonine-protein kinase HipA [Quisquiliibacterium transsilvanicum]|uniref:Serine/threonine-protein kinase HipA n=2 Tax=Quisquiliibacterium transsilvanicum TaxID=1549638 RepID=A0A7W8HJ34_9BURK|nr:type II toxin-antitoxin system HipA family toxin [Quisquiliibacterium transsilvanicum]MBB5272990.1 serine/threonine-protein kinase HipA [Quisquiliibacterium transsilvanicum]